MITPPCPWHWGQVELMLKKPLDCVTWPRPWQRLQTCGDVPGAQPDPRHEEHRTYFCRLISVVAPRAASMKEIPQIIAQVGARPGSRAGTGASRTETEDVAEDVSETGEDVFETGKSPVTGAA